MEERGGLPLADYEARRADSAERKLKAVKETLERRVAALEARPAGVSQHELNRQLGSIIKGIAGPIKEAIDKATNGAMCYRGIHQRAEQYHKGDAVTSDGALWFCIRDVDGAEGKPGGNEAAAAWQLMAKGPR